MNKRAKHGDYHSLTMQTAAKKKNMRSQSLPDVPWKPRPDYMEVYCKKSFILTFEQMAFSWLIKLWILQCKSLERFHINMANISVNANDGASADFPLFRSKSHYGIDYGVQRSLRGGSTNANFMTRYVLTYEKHSPHQMWRWKSFLLAYLRKRDVCQVKKEAPWRRKPNLDFLG